MKKILCACFVIFCTLTVYAHDGIGDFKIGMALDDFLELPAIKAKNIRDKELRDYKLKEIDLWVTRSDRQSLSTFEKVFSEDVVKFDLLMELGIKKRSTGRDSYEGTMFFYKNRLVIIEVDDVDWEMEDILKEKYGKPVVISEAKVITCQNRFGVKSQYLKGVITSKWASNKNTAEHQRLYFNCGDENAKYKVTENVTAKIVRKIQADGAKSEIDAERKGRIKESKF